MLIATGSLISEIVNVFSNVKETRIKVLSSYPSGHVEVRCPVDKKNISVVKKIALMQWKVVANAI